jgi:hypothetical protein
MRLSLLLLFVISFVQTSRAQLLVAPDTLRSFDRVIGSADSLLQFMDGFSAPFFIGTGQTQPSLWSVFKPGSAPLSSAAFSHKNLTFSALPHLGFAYGFGAQGSQRLRLDYEQLFAKHTLLNVRYDRHQQAGFIRASELRMSSLEVQVAQYGKRYQLLASFSNLSNDRQWSGGLVNWSQIGLVSAELLPVVKASAHTFQNGYQAKLDASYSLGSDSLSGLRIITKNAYHQQLRRYEETDSLELYYSQLNFYTDSCRDVFASQIWQHQIGLAYVQKKLLLSSAFELRSMYWQDNQFSYDTTELNLVNEVKYQFKAGLLKHNSAINFVGAGGGIHSDTRFESKLPFGKIQIQHLFLRAWPELMQRTYFSNLTSYQVIQPQLQQSMLLDARYTAQLGPIESRFSMAYMRNQKVYRFNSQLMNWQIVGPQSAYQATLDFVYKTKGWRFSTQTAFSNWQLSNQNILPPLTSELHVQWGGGVLKNKQLKLVAGAAVQAMYGGVFSRMSYLPYLETLDWQVYGNQALYPVERILNAKAELLLEVKTFRFFVQATNMLGFIDPSASLYQGIPYPSMQIRIGLTWDFWN